MSSLGKFIALKFTLFSISLYTCSKHRRNSLSVTITMHLFISVKFSSNDGKEKRKKEKGCHKGSKEKLAALNA